MAYYLVQASYGAAAIGAMVKHPQDRAAAIRPLLERMGGKLHGMWFTFGEYDDPRLPSVQEGEACHDVPVTPIVALAADHPNRATGNLPENCRSRVVHQDRAGNADFFDASSVGFPHLGGAEVPEDICVHRSYSSKMFPSAWNVFANSTVY